MKPKITYNIANSPKFQSFVMKSMPNIKRIITNFGPDVEIPTLMHITMKNNNNTIKCICIFIDKIFLAFGKLGSPR